MVKLLKEYEAGSAEDRVRTGTTAAMMLPIFQIGVEWCYTVSTLFESLQCRY